MKGNQEHGRGRIPFDWRKRSEMLEGSRSIGGVRGVGKQVSSGKVLRVPHLQVLQIRRCRRCGNRRENCGRLAVAAAEVSFVSLVSP